VIFKVISGTINSYIVSISRTVYIMYEAINMWAINSTERTVTWYWAWPSCYVSDSYVSCCRHAQLQASSQTACRAF